MTRLCPSHLLSTVALVILLGGLAPFSANGQEAGDDAALRGFVRSEADGTPLQGANVVLRTPDGAIEDAAVTDGDGFYQVARLSSGRYFLRISFVGYQPYQDTLRLPPDARRTLSVSLEAASRTLEGVTVEGQGPVEDAKAGLRRIESADIETIPTPGPGADLASYLRSLPSVTTTGDRGGRLYVRGGTPSQNLVLVDGVPIYKPFHIVGLYSTFPGDLVSNADFYAGGFGAEYTSRMSSVLDVQLRPGNTKEIQGSVGAGPFLSSVRFEGPLQRGSKSFLVQARHSLIEESGPTLLGQSTPYKFYDLTAKFHTQSESNQCSFIGVRSYDRGRIDPTRNASFKWDNTVVGGDCLIFGGESSQTLEVSFGTSHFNNSVRSADRTNRTAGTWIVHTRFELTQPAPWDGSLYWGGRVQANQYDLSLQEPFLGVEGESQFILSGALHGGLTWTWNDQFTANPTIGVQSLDDADGVSLDPRLRLSYEFGTDRPTKLTAAGGIYHQLTAGVTDERDAGSTFRAITPTPYPSNPSQSIHAILGWDQMLASSLHLSLEGWYKNLQDLPVPRWTPIVRFNTNLVRANGTALGADASLKYNEDPVRLSLTYGYGAVTYRAAENRLGAWADQSLIEYSPPHDLRHKVGVTAGFDADWVSANVRWQYTSGRPYTQVYGYDTMLEIRGLRDDPTSAVGIPRALYQRPYEARLPAYHRLDVSLQRQFTLSPSVGLTAEAGAINSYNRSNVFYIDIFTLDRVDQLPVIPYLSLSVDIN